ncbi:MAG TPA: DNA polymerase III subunit gamma/tau [Candidatus Azoamicus sp.]
MTYITLSNKWRPKNLNALIGQDQAIFSLKNIIKSKKIHPAYIIHGPQGTGKTSLARIITKCINCEKQITKNPCNNCNCCISIEKNKNNDSIEIDGASKTKIEEIKNIIDLAQYKNSNNRYRTFIIDECHMLSQSSFNYLLKILEEPYINTIYILITTQIEKIPKTVLSRCINLQLNKLNKKNIKTHVKKILKEENVIFDDISLDYIAIFSNGSLRSAINIIEKLITENKIINKKDTRLLLGILPDLSILFIIKNMYEKDIKNLISNIKKITEICLNYKNIFIQIQITLYKILLYKADIIYDKNLCEYNIFIYLSKKMNKNYIINLYNKFIELTLSNNVINDIDFEIALISFSIEL